jgi:hypothetical protein
VFDELPDQPKTKLLRVLKRRKPAREKLAISNLKRSPKIFLSDTVRQCLTSWKLAPSSFLEQHKVQEVYNLENPLAHVFILLSTWDERRAITLIQRRILLVVLNRLKEKLCTRLTDDAVRRIGLVIFQSGLVNQAYESIEAKISTWVLAGARYNQLVDDFGGSGCLTLLPEDISCYM